MGVRTMPYVEAEGKPQFAGMGSGGSGGGGGSSYTLHPATASRLGGVKIGSGVTVTSDGTISVEGGGGGGMFPDYANAVDISEAVFNNQTYTAPSNGFFSIIVSGGSTERNYYINNTLIATGFSYSGVDYPSISCGFFPVSMGDVLTASVSSGRLEENHIKFIPCT